MHIGISGWSYYDWKGIFYPEGMKSKDWLPFYAQSFETTELNSSFYHLPKAQTVLNWVEKVPANFKFCPKMSKYLTHVKRLNDPEEPLQRFFEVFAPAKDKLGPILVQLPPSLQFNEEVATSFFEVLKRDYDSYDFAIEPRHASWLAEPAFQLLSKYDMAWVISQSGVGFPYAEQVTAKNIYVRFHGPGKLYASLYTEEMLQTFADQFKKWLKKGHDIWVYFNNCYFCYAIYNARTLEEMMKS